jgi:dolichol-phosphate mannosyltransferase
VEYVREERFAGETKYPLKKMLKFASDALTSFSYKPLRLSTQIGFVLSAASFIYLLVVIFAGLPGWAALAAVLLFFNGILLIMLGIAGEYIGRIYDEAKGRPLYIVEEKAGFEQNAK